MRVRRRPVVLGCLALVLLAGLALTVLVYRAVDPVYGVTDVQAGLRQQPRSWAGRVFLLRGVITMQGLLVGCGRPACPGASWIVLLPTHEPAWSEARQLAVSMDIGRRRGSRDGHLVPTNPLGQGLVLVAPPGFSSPPAHSSGVLPDGAYHIPLLGPLLSRWLPATKDNSFVVRVRLAPLHSCAILGLCPDGWVV